MLILKLVLRNLARHPRRTLLLGFLIAVGIATLFTANSVFNGTNRGLEASFVRSLTGDAAVSTRSVMTFSLFGTEVPIVSEYESIPPIPQYADLVSIVSNNVHIEAWTPVVSGAAQLKIAGQTFNVPIFGVDPDSYFDVCTDIKITKGNVDSLKNGGVFINEALLGSIESSIGHPLEVGEEIVFGMYSNGSFRLKKGSFAGVHRYIAPTDMLDLVVLADATIVRSIANYTLGFALRDKQANPETSAYSSDLDDLFSDAADVESPREPGLTLDAVEKEMSDTRERDALVMTDLAAWSFILVRAIDGHKTRIARELEYEITASGLECRAMNWRSAAGSSAQTLFAIQTAFYIGLGFVSIGAILVIMNALVISVLERSTEIGTMRGLGAGTNFIQKLFIGESMILTLSGTIIGILAGFFISIYFQKAGIPIANPLLASLFGGETVYPVPTFSSALGHLLMAAGVGAISWIYPVFLAMRVQPITAMNGR